MLTIKKYSNRRLYDTEQSHYITLGELGQRIREGNDVQVLDARTSEDLTQATLTQLVIEGRGAGRWLSATVLTQLVRMQDDLLADFLGRFLGVALELYLAARRGAASIPLGSLPFGATDPFARMLASAAMWTGMGSSSGPLAAPTPAPAEPEPSPAGAASADIAELRRELAAIKRRLERGGRRSG
jgi:polyhydroxyalkanoate synthesis repressor PhaR